MAIFMNRILAVLVLSVCALSWSSVSLADTIELTNGKTLEGTVEKTEGDTIIVRLASGATMALSKDTVSKVTKSSSGGAQLDELEEKIKRGDSASLFRLAGWCEEQGLAEDSARLLWQTLEVNPHHAEARTKLGFKKHKKRWLIASDYQVATGHVHGDRGWQKRADWQKAAIERFGADKLKRATEDFRTAASRGHQDDRKHALESFRAFQDGVRRRVLVGQLDSPQWRHRQFAVRELGLLNDRHQTPLLTRVAVHDRKQSVRNEALRVLKDWSDPDTALYFIPYVGSSSDSARVNATRALNVFPDRRAVGPMVDTAQAVWAGFGRVHIANVVQRSYIKDYELVSGGTGLVVIEVADPVVDTFQEGVVLDIDIRRAEATSRAAALQRATGRSFGADYAKWESWWKDNAGTKFASAAGRPQPRG